MSKASGRHELKALRSDHYFVVIKKLVLMFRVFWEIKADEPQVFWATAKNCYKFVASIVTIKNKDSFYIIHHKDSLL